MKKQSVRKLLSSLIIITMIVANVSFVRAEKVSGADIQVHNFTSSGKTSSFYSILGNLSTSKGSVSYNGNKLTQCLKMESTTNITFTAPADGTLTLVFGGTTEASGKTVEVNGTKYTCGSDGIAKVSVSSGSVTITKGDTINLFYMIYTPSGSSSGGSSSTTQATSQTTTQATTSNNTTQEADDEYTLYVGSSRTYKTVNAALTAAKKMNRSSSQRITIKIDPGNYEEMLVIDADNITLKNSSTTPSTELKNKGVDIDSNAVRITWYYGHGYTYYSMGSDYQCSDSVLSQNKSNGKASVTNPGAGSATLWNATVSIKADGFCADGIIFENSFNQYVSKKAANDVIVAQGSAKEGSTPRANLSVGSTKVQEKEYVERAAAVGIANNVKEADFRNCKFVGRQDTLYGGKSVTAVFEKCSIYGGTDYIFGGMKALFYQCNLVANTNDLTSSGISNDKFYITAPQQTSGRGYLFYECRITSTTPGVDTSSTMKSKPGYFGRPWAADTGEAVFYKTTIEKTNFSKDGKGTGNSSLIVAEGWLDTLKGESKLCGEYGTIDLAGASTSNRVSWAQVFTQPKLADGTAIAIESYVESGWLSRLYASARLTAASSHTHSYSSSVTKTPTCTETGVRTYICSCGNSYTETIVATGHSYTSTVTKNPTCTVAGVKTYICSCGDSYTEGIPATGVHSYETSWTIDKAPTTTTTGSKSHHCSSCDAKTDVTSIPKLIDTSSYTSIQLSGENGILTITDTLQVPIVLPKTLVKGQTLTVVMCVEDNGGTGFRCYAMDEGANSVSNIFQSSSTDVSNEFSFTLTATEDSNAILVKGPDYQTNIGNVVIKYVKVLYGETSGEKLNGLNKVDGVWGYYTDGVINTDYTGLAENSSGMWYVESGMVSLKATGLYKINGVWYYLKGSKLQSYYTGLATNTSGVWYVQNGKVTMNTSGLYKISGVWYYMSGSKVQTGFTGIATNGSGDWYVENGVVSLVYNGKVTINSITYTISGSKVVNQTKTGVLTKVNGTWYYMINDAVATYYTGTATNGAGKWYVQNGVVSLKATGLYKVDGTWYYLSGSKVQSGYTGLATNSSGKWYVENGVVTLKYNGNVTISGVTYTVVNSKVQ